MIMIMKRIGKNVPQPVLLSLYLYPCISIIHTVPTVILFVQLIEPPLSLSIIYLFLKEADSYNQYCPRPYRAATLSLRIW